MEGVGGFLEHKNAIFRGIKLDGLHVWNIRRIHETGSLFFMWHKKLLLYNSIPYTIHGSYGIWNKHHKKIVLPNGFP